MTLPNFLIIGANRAGTTSLYHYLQQHPDVYMSPLKEPLFFSGLDLSRPRLAPPPGVEMRVAATRAEYEALFDGAAGHRVIGEASTAYLHDPRTPARIKQELPGARLMAMLRDPVERALSMHSQIVVWGLEPVTDFAEPIRLEQRPGDWRPYLRLGFYHDQVKRYLDTFDHARLRLYLYDDFVARPLEIWHDLCRFLEITDEVVPDMSHRHNRTLRPRSRAVTALLRTPPPRLRRLASFLPSGLRGRLRLKLHGLSLVKPSVPPALRRQLVGLYRDDICRLQDLLGRDLSHWLR